MFFHFHTILHTSILCVITIIKKKKKITLTNSRDFQISLWNRAFHRGRGRNPSGWLDSTFDRRSEKLKRERRWQQKGERKRNQNDHKRRGREREREESKNRRAFKSRKGIFPKEERIWDSDDQQQKKSPNLQFQSPFGEKTIISIVLGRTIDLNASSTRRKRFKHYFKN